MSVTTTADEKILEAKNALSVAYKALLEVLDEDTYGHNQIDNERIIEISETATKIYQLKKKL